MEFTSSQKWKDDKWKKTVYSWIESELASNNLEKTGEITQFHIRPWSTVFNVPVKNGLLYFKACAPVLRHEVPLSDFLFKHNVECSPEILSINAEKGWLLLYDGGQPMRSLIQKEQKADHWFKVLPLFAGIQIELINYTDQLLQLGVFDRRISKLPDLFKNLLEDKEALFIDQKDGLTTQQYQRLKGFLPQFETMCQELRSYNIPESLHHDDFHDNNIFVKKDRYTFADWGESCISHPFFSIIIALRVTAYILKLEDNDPVINQLRDTYLQVWQNYGTGNELKKAFELAGKVGMVNRALTWYQIVTNLTGDEKKEYCKAVPGWLHDFFNAVEI